VDAQVLALRMRKLRLAECLKVRDIVTDNGTHIVFCWSTHID
jgi:hypothetical protein